MKRIISLLLAVFFVGTVIMSPLNAWAKEEKQGEVIVEEHVRFLNRSEAIKLVVEKEGISYDEAEKRFQEVQKTSIDGLLRSSTSYPTYTKVYKYPGGAQIEIGGIWELFIDGSFRQFNGLKSKWTIAVGSGGYTWKQAHVTDTTARYPAVNVSLSGRGVVEIEVRNSSGSSVGAQLKGMGFTVSKSTTKVTYYRKTVDLYLSESIYK